MHAFELARRLIDIESITPNERRSATFYLHLTALARRFDGRIERMPVEEDRDNLFVHFGDPIVTLSTHIGHRSALHSIP